VRAVAVLEIPAGGPRSQRQCKKKREVSKCKTDNK
jgi:hypothetical protein